MPGPNSGQLNPGVVQIATAMAAGSGELVALIDAAGMARLLNADAVLRDMIGYEAIELSPQVMLGLVHPEDAARVREVIPLVLGQPRTKQVVQYRVRHRDGRWVTLQSSAVNYLGEVMIRAVVVHTRALPRVQEIVDEPTDSGLTGLVDKPGFLRTLGETVQHKVDRVWRASLPDGTVVPDPRCEYTLLLVELDRFKMLLGSHGQQVADHMLAEISERLRTVVGRKDVVGHLGGGELGILVRGVGDANVATTLADRIQDLVAEQMHIEGQVVSTSAIVGMATSQRRYDRADDVMSDAAAALNRARREHRRRRRAAFKTEMRVEDKAVITLLAELPQALKQNQFVLHYQPLVSLEDGHLLGFEALVRWNHPQRGLIPPVQFIELAEQTGFIVDLGQWVLRESCRQFHEWHRTLKLDPLPWVSVNVSVAQLNDELPRTVARILTETGFDPGALKLETTESAVMKSKDAAVKVLDALQAQGVSLSLDDFGTGYSSFSNLQELPYDTLKIDRSFIAQLGAGGGRDDVDPRDIIAAMINLAHALKMTVVAEGVETMEQLDVLADLRCDIGQGFYFARPLTPEAAETLMVDNPTW
ncbi:MAG: GGDEF and EAL domain-containing protein [Deltaproteobacteria bacterium]|nr:GGDEF and EAL domain-containing protein [Deltaproteobacteria bacterium]MBW2536668.1 GGDEF and EAL domain-containing protein [Deltaproteobacteria bacterium]